MPKNKLKNHFKWTDDFSGTPVYWANGNFEVHKQAHPQLRDSEEVFVQALTNPDVVFPDRYQDGARCYYKLDGLNIDGKKRHAKVVTMKDNPPRALVKGQYMVVKSAHVTPSVKEEFVKEPLFDNRKKKNDHS